MSKTTLICAILLIIFVTAGPAAAYYPPDIPTARANSVNGEKSFRFAVTGPGAFDIASITIQGPSAEIYNLDPLVNVQGMTYIQSYTKTFGGEGPLADGAYLFTVTDKMGRSATATVNYTAQSVISVDMGDISPSMGEYTGTTTPTLSLADKGVGISYYFRISDYYGQNVFWETDSLSTNSISVPSGVLQPDTPYRLQGTATAGNMTLDYTGLTIGSATINFYTGTKANPPSFSDSFIMYTDLGSGQHYRQAFFRIPGLAPWDFVGANFQISLTPPGESPVSEDLTVQARSWQPCYYYSITSLGAGTPAAGLYNFAASDDLANNFNVDRTYVQETIAPAEAIRPAEGRYVGSPNFTVTWRPPAGATSDWRYQVRVRRFGASYTYVYSSGLLSGTSHQIASGTPLTDHHTYYVSVLAYANSTPSSHEYMNLAFSGVNVHLDSRLSNPSIQMPLFSR